MIYLKQVLKLFAQNGCVSNKVLVLKHLHFFPIPKLGQYDPKWCEYPTEPALLVPSSHRHCTYQGYLAKIEEDTCAGGSLPCSVVLVRVVVVGWWPFSLFSVYELFRRWSWKTNQQMQILESCMHTYQG